ncbi:MAG: hypothetical protein N2A97_01205 [Thermodesulfobacteriales bacterium]
MKKTKEDVTSAGTPKKKKPENKGRLSSMLESMQKRSSPVKAHRVATKYFDDFKKDRSITSIKETQKETTAVGTAVNSAVVTAVNQKAKKPSSTKPQNKISQPEILEDSHTPSESKVYLFMREEASKKKSSQLRFGLKELKGKTGLSDKTIRNAIHSLEEKLSIKVVEPSLGVYGRKIRVFEPEEVSRNRKNAGLIIDSTTKRIINGATAVSTAVGSTVTTAVDRVSEYKDKVKSLYESYTENKWDENAEKFYKSINNIKPEIIEAALILGILKDGDKNKQISDFKTLIKDVGDSIPKPYLNHLRNIWKERKVK